MEIVSAFFHPGLIVFVGVLSRPLFLFWRRKRIITVDKGYHYMMWGVSLIALGTFVDYTTEVVLVLNTSSMQQFSYAVNYRTMMALVFLVAGYSKFEQRNLFAPTNRTQAYSGKDGC